MSTKIITAAIVGFCFFGPFVSFHVYGDNFFSNTPGTVQMQDKATTDSDITTSVSNSFVNDKNLAPYAGNVLVRSNNGVITLSGSAPSEKIKFDFENKAKSMTGVAKVVNNIEVKQGVIK